MALTAVGLTNRSVDLAEWARIGWGMSQAHAGEVVTEGFDVAAGTGLNVTVSPGYAYVNNVEVRNDAPVTVPVPANATRIVQVLMDWSNGGLLISPVTATPWRTPGVSWQLPLAWVTTNATGFTEISRAKPLPAKVYRHTVAMTPKDLNGASASPASIGALHVQNPGWPYVLTVTGYVRVSGDDGYTYARVLADGATVAAAHAANLTTDNGAQPLPLSGVSEVLTGSTEVVVDAVVLAGTQGKPVTVLSASYVHVTMTPA